MNEFHSDRFYQSLTSPLYVSGLCIFLSFLCIHLFSWAQGQAILGSSDYKSNVSLGLFWGKYDDRGRKAIDSTIYYEWCSMNSGAEVYDETLCTYKYIAQYGIVFGVGFLILLSMSLSYLHHRFISVSALKQYLRITSLVSFMSALCFLFGNMFWLMIVLKVSSGKGPSTEVKTASGERMAIQVSYSWLISCFISALLIFLTAYFLLVLQSFPFDRLLKKNNRHLQRQFSDRLIQTTLNSVRQKQRGNFNIGNDTKTTKTNKVSADEQVNRGASIQPLNYNSSKQSIKYNQSDIRNLASLKERNQTLMEEGRINIANTAKTVE